jgi:quercetin dioxygenase-like cupin family protein
VDGAGWRQCGGIDLSFLSDIFFDIFCHGGVLGYRRTLVLWVPIVTRNVDIDAPFQLAGMRPDRAADFTIGGTDRPYMLRWYILPRNEVFNVYYHRILRDDDDRALHDHPWPSFSIMTQGTMREILPGGESRLIRAGDCVYRGPDFAHRLVLINGNPAETIFITGPKVRDWGFHCPKGFVHWRDFVGIDDPGAVGRGCGEMS